MKIRNRAALSAVILATWMAPTAFADGPEVMHVEKKITTTRTVYDAVGNVTVINPSGNTTTYSYDAEGSRSATDGTGNTTTYTYDALDRATSSGGPTTFTYDATGTDSTMSTTGGTTTNTYDKAGNMQSDPDALGNTTTYSYDAEGRGMTTETDPLGRTTTNQYDSLNRVTGVSGNDSLGNTTTYDYDSAGRRIEMIDSIGGVDNSNNNTTSTGSADFDVTTQTQYDALGRINAMDGGSSIDVSIYDITTGLPLFQYDAATPDALGLTTTYQYDPVGGPSSGVVTGQLEGMLVPGDTYRYSYSYDLSQDPAISQTGSGGVSLELDLTPIPEPATTGLLLSGATLLAARRRRK